MVQRTAPGETAIGKTPQRYVLERRISHADVDLLGEMKVAALLGLLEQAAVEASWDAGFDPEWYAAQRRVWIIRRTRLERLVPVGGGDRVRVVTQVADWRRARSLRRYEVWCDARSPVPVARATTDWVYCDMASGRPASVPAEMRRAFSGDDLGASLPRAPALEAGAEGPEASYALTVQPSQLDHVVHVNNAVYGSFLEDAAFGLFAGHGLGVDRMLALGGALRIRALDIEHRSDAVADDHLEVRSWLLSATGLAAPRGQGAATPPGPARLRQLVERASGEQVVRAESEWVWRHRPRVLGGVPAP